MRDIAPGCGGTTDEKVDKEKQHHSCVGGNQRETRERREGEREGGREERGLYDELSGFEWCYSDCV